MSSSSLVFVFQKHFQLWWKYFFMVILFQWYFAAIMPDQWDSLTFVYSIQNSCILKSEIIHTSVQFDDVRLIKLNYSLMWAFSFPLRFSNFFTQVFDWSELLQQHQRLFCGWLLLQPTDTAPEYSMYVLQTGFTVSVTLAPYLWQFMENIAI